MWKLVSNLFFPSASALWFAGVHNEHAIAGHTCICYTVSRMRVRVMSGYSGMPHKHISLAGTNASLGKRAPTPSRTASVSHATFIRCRVLSSVVSSFAPPTTFFPLAKRLSCHAETPRRDLVIYRPRWLACHALKDDPLPTTIPSTLR